jgi:endonuclease III
VANQIRRERARKLRAVVSKLEVVFGRRRRRRRPEALETVLYAIVADGVTDARAEGPFENVRKEMVDWNELRVTRGRDIEALLSGLPQAAVKSEVIRSFLGKVFSMANESVASFMQKWSGAKAAAFLEQVEGMTESMRSRALLKGFEVDVLPITADIVRVMKRLGVVEAHLSQDKVHEFLKEVLAPKRTYAFFHLVNEHADRFCLQRAPLCDVCPVNRYCDKYASDKSKRGATPGSGAGSETSK